MAYFHRWTGSKTPERRCDWRGSQEGARTIYVPLFRSAVIHFQRCAGRNPSDSLLTGGDDRKAHVLYREPFGVNYLPKRDETPEKRYDWRGSQEGARA